MTDINPRSRRFEEYREASASCARRFDSAYWQRVERKARYPEEFVKALERSGMARGADSDRVRRRRARRHEASVILEEINRSGANSGACHAQMYIMGTLLRHGSAEQKRDICRGSHRASCGCSRSRSPSRRRHGHDPDQDVRADDRATTT